jgi:Glycosyl hydrolases family 2
MNSFGSVASLGVCLGSEAVVSGGIEITVGDVNDVEARVYARYAGPIEGPDSEEERIVLVGTVRGPYCEGTRTLPAQFNFRQKDAGRIAEAEAFVPDPCTWSAELPHLYQADIEARQGDRVIAEFHGTIGLRRSTS